MPWQVENLVIWDIASVALEASLMLGHDESLDPWELVWSLGPQGPAWYWSALGSQGCLVLR